MAAHLLPLFQYFLKRLGLLALMTLRRSTLRAGYARWTDMLLCGFTVRILFNNVLFDWFFGYFVDWNVFFHLNILFSPLVELFADFLLYVIFLYRLVFDFFLHLFLQIEIIDDLISWLHFYKLARLVHGFGSWAHICTVGFGLLLF